MAPGRSTSEAADRFQPGGNGEADLDCSPVSRLPAIAERVGPLAALPIRSFGPSMRTALQAEMSDTMTSRAEQRQVFERRAPLTLLQRPAVMHVKARPL